MEHSVQNALRMLIVNHGYSVCQDRLRLEGLLRDSCSKHPKEIRLLLLGVDEHIPDALLKAVTNGGTHHLLPRLTSRLKNNFALTPEASNWVVESWACALGIHPSSQTSSTMVWDTWGWIFFQKRWLMIFLIILLFVCTGYLQANTDQETYSIQVFSSTSKANASSYLCSLIKKGFDGLIVQTSSWNKVRIEEFNNRGKADHIAAFLKSKHIIAEDSFVIQSSFDWEDDFLEITSSDCLGS